MGILINNATLDTLYFADDQIIAAQEHNDLEYMTRKLVKNIKVRVWK